MVKTNNINNNEPKYIQIELINLLETIHKETKILIKMINLNNYIIEESYKKIEILSSNLQFNKKYIIFNPIKVIELKNKIKTNLENINDCEKKSKHMDYNNELIKIYQLNKVGPIQIITIKTSGFDGALIKNLVENTMINFSIIYVKLSEKIKINKNNLFMNDNLLIEYYLFFREQNEKFIELNEIFISK